MLFRGVPTDKFYVDRGAPTVPEAEAIVTTTVVVVRTYSVPFRILHMHSSFIEFVLTILRVSS